MTTPFFFLYRVVFSIKRRIDRISYRAIDYLLSRHFEAKSGGRVTYQGWPVLPGEEDDRWSGKASAPGRLTIIVVTYRQPEPLRCLLASLRCQTMQNFDVIVLHDGPDAETRRVVEEHRALASAACRYIESEVRYNDYGHSLRAMGIEQATGDFILITNGDNYYSPRLVEFAFRAVDLGQLDLVIWDIVHSHWRVSFYRAACTPFDSYPVHFRIDMGAFFVKTALAKATGFTSRAHDADAIYLTRLLEETQGPVRIGKVQKTLMVHN